MTTLTARINALENRVTALEAKPTKPAIDLELIEETRAMRLHGRWFYFRGEEQWRCIGILAAALRKSPGLGLPYSLLAPKENDIEWRLSLIFRNHPIIRDGYLTSPEHGLWMLIPTPAPRNNRATFSLRHSRKKLAKVRSR